jgi:MFS family permease
MKNKDAQQIAKVNLRLFICFRMLFNARFYYPIYALLFLEHGLSWEEFGILNGIWAITIIVLEVPSGALADTLGRKKLLVLAAVCMMVEMLALLLAPMNGSEYVFMLFALNRVVSGLAEAAASGADEALAYDSLKEAGMENNWNKTLEKAQRFTSLAFFFAMMTGSAFYDAPFINSCMQSIGLDFSMTSDEAIKAPIFLTFLSSLVVLGAAMGMRDSFVAEKMGAWETMKSSFRKTVQAGTWIWKTPLPFGILIGAMALDNVIRQFLTIASAYWSVIESSRCHIRPGCVRNVFDGGIYPQACPIPQRPFFTPHKLPHPLHGINDWLIWNWICPTLLGNSACDSSVRNHADHELSGQSIPQ